MSSPETDTQAAPAKSMDEIMALCKRRGFIYQASEIYGGVNGFWDYGPLGARLKKNLKDAWWRDMVDIPPDGPDGHPVAIVPVDSCIIQNPKVWEASGHIAGFNDPRVDCRETKHRYRADHIFLYGNSKAKRHYAYLDGDSESELNARAKLSTALAGKWWAEESHQQLTMYLQHGGQLADVVGPDTNTPGTLTEPRAFNLMFQTHIGATATGDDVAYLRPETAQGIFVNYKNVIDSSRVKIPFGIAQIGKAFRNEVTPRNFTFRSREFEQMEIEFFCHPSETRQWYEFWRDVRMKWWQSIGLAGDNLQMREHETEELAHYAKEGAGTADVEYRFPFTAPGFGELEGVADRTDFDLRQHAEHSGAKLEYFDQERNERYLPHCIEPSAGADRGALAAICEAFTPTPERKGSKYVMRFHPRLAPIKAAVFPLVNKEGMPEVAQRLHKDLRAQWGAVEYDAKQSIGKRYARMDEAGCPFCFTIDGETLTDQTVTVRHRDDASQERINLDRVAAFLAEKLGG